MVGGWSGQESLQPEKHGDFASLMMSGAAELCGHPVTRTDELPGGFHDDGLRMRVIVPAPNVPKFMGHQADGGPKVDNFKEIVCRQ